MEERDQTRADRPRLGLYRMAEYREPPPNGDRTVSAPAGAPLAELHRMDDPLPPCPDCGGAIEWAENGRVPGSRVCGNCGAEFRIHPRRDPGAGHGHGRAEDSCGRAGTTEGYPQDIHDEEERMSETRTHHLGWESEKPNREEVERALGDISEDCDRTVADRLAGQWIRWPNHQLHLSKLSMKWPETTFTLEYQGLELGDRRREHHRKGMMHQEEIRWSDTGFDPAAEPAGPGTMSFARLDRTSLPEPSFQCEGRESGFTDLENVHFRDDTGGITEPDELWYAELVDEEYKIETSGFFCTDCLGAAGLTPEGRPTLLDEMERRAGTEPGC